MFTKKDAEIIGKIVDDKLSNKLKEWTDYLLKDIVDLFSATNERVDKVLDKLNNYKGDINDHERRIEKIEEKFVTS